MTAGTHADSLYAKRRLPVNKGAQGTGVSWLYPFEYAWREMNFYTKEPADRLDWIGEMPPPCGGYAVTTPAKLFVPTREEFDAHVASGGWWQWRFLRPRTQPWRRLPAATTYEDVWPNKLHRDEVEWRHGD